jgi:opacity protein-like surface antigen
MISNALRILTPRIISGFSLGILSLMVLTITPSAGAQTSEGHKFNFNVGAGVTPLVGDISARLNTGWHVTIGAGYNFVPSFGVDAEYMYTGLGVNQSVLNQLSVPNGDAHVHSVTIDPIFRFKRGERFGAYAIVGGGYYRRTVEFFQPTTAVVDVFDPWWGYIGPVIVPVNQILGSVTSNAGGFNAGLGTTINLGGSGLKFYGEVRYHYANTHRSRTEMLPITFGIRW